MTSKLTTRKVKKYGRFGLYSNNDKVDYFDNSGREADRKDELVRPDSIYILSCKQSSGTCFCKSNKN